MRRGARSFLAILLATLHFAGCGAALRAIDPGADKIPKLADAARRLSPSGPKPLWSTTIRAPETDILQFVSENRILVGEVRIESGMAILPLATTPSTGPIALYDGDSGRQVWSRPRLPLPPGQYSVVAVSPVILILGTDAKKAVFTALDPETGAIRWEQTFSAPYGAVPSPDGEHLVVTSGGWLSRKLAAVSIRSGGILWERTMDRDRMPKDRPPLLTPAGDLLLVAGKSILALSPATGTDIWNVPSPFSGEEIVSASEWGEGILVAGKTRVALLDAGTGAVRWSRPGGEGVIRAALPAEGAGLLWIRTPGGRDRLAALSPKDGSTRWKKDLEERIRSPLLLSGRRVYYTVDRAVVAQELDGGKAAFRTVVPGWGTADLPDIWLPDLLEFRGGALVVARETFGVAKVEAGTGKLLFARGIPYETTHRTMFKSRASDLFGAYWSGKMKDLERVEKKFKTVMSDLQEGVAASAQGDAGTAALIARAGASTPRGPSGAGSGSSFEREQALREVKSYDSAISREIRAGKTLADPKYSALYAGRNLARESARQESQARVSVLGAERAVIATRASMNQMMATINLCNSVMGVLDSMGAAIRESEGLKRYVDLRHAVEIHRRSLQERHYLRPDQSGEAQGMIVVDLETGDRADVLFGVYNRDMAKDFGVDLPLIAESPRGDRLVTKGITLDPAGYESYSLSPFLFPYPSLLSIDARGLSRWKIPLDESGTARSRTLVEASGMGDLAAVREFLKAGASPESRDSSGNSALVLAASRGYEEVVRLLLRSGARYDLPDGQNNLPLYRAVVEGREAAVDVLLREGADIHGNHLGTTPLGWSVVNGRPGVVGLLLSRGADPRKLDTKHPPEAVLKDANLIKGLCTDAVCRSRFDEATDLIRKAWAK